MNLNNWDKDSVGELLHTGWRKGHDSKWSSLVWNLVYILPPFAWTMFVDFMAERLQSVELTDFNTDFLRKAYHDFSDEIQWYPKRDEPGYNTKDRPKITAFRVALEMATDTDLACDISWIKYCLDIEDDSQDTD